MLESGITFDVAQLVMDNEFVRMIRQTVAGLTVNAETLAVRVIDEVGPAGEFLTRDHTFAHMRDHSRPELIDRRRMADWQAAGGCDIRRRAVAKARWILDHHRPPPLDEAVQAEIRFIIEETAGQLGVV
jgi:trimethylamine--corrinoid protein Co-methyltransferase